MIPGTERKAAGTLSLLVLALASCGAAPSGDNADSAAGAAALQALAISDLATFVEPWAMAFIPGTKTALITERAGRLLLWQEGAQPRAVGGVPGVDFGGQGGLGDVAVRPGNNRPVVYLTFAEAGSGDTRGAALARAELVDDGRTPRLEGVEVIWRQQPKVSGRGHYSHRIAFSPDGRYLYVSSGDRQKMAPAQDPGSDLGKIVRLPLDASGRPAGPAEHLSLGHRNVLGLAFDAQGRLWDLEHGPAGGDEINLVEPGRNYGWPLVSEGDHYNGTAIARHATRPDLAAPAISWNPVIGPGNMVIWSGRQFPEWQGQAIIAGMVYPGLVRVAFTGETAREVGRIPLGNRIREIEQGPDGELYVLEDGDSGRLRRIAPR